MNVDLTFALNGSRSVHCLEFGGIWQGKSFLPCRMWKERALSGRDSSWAGAGADVPRHNSLMTSTIASGIMCTTLACSFQVLPPFFRMTTAPPHRD